MKFLANIWLVTWYCCFASRRCVYRLMLVCRWEKQVIFLCLIKLRYLTSERHGGNKWCLPCSDCPAGREVPRLLGWVLEKVNILVYAGKAWGSVLVTEHMASMAAHQGRRNHVFPCKYNKKINCINRGGVYSGNMYRKHYTKWVPAKKRKKMWYS